MYRCCLDATAARRMQNFTLSNTQFCPCFQSMFNQTGTKTDFSRNETSISIFFGLWWDSFFVFFFKSNICLNICREPNENVFHCRGNKSNLSLKDSIRSCSSKWHGGVLKLTLALLQARIHRTTIWRPLYFSLPLSPLFSYQFLLCTSTQNPPSHALVLYQHPIHIFRRNTVTQLRHLTGAAWGRHYGGVEETDPYSCRQREFINIASHFSHLGGRLPFHNKSTCPATCWMTFYHIEKWERE